MNVCYFTLITLVFSLPSLNYLFDIWNKVSKNIQETRKFVLAPADKATNNVVVVWRFYYINTQIQELDNTKTYERISTDERSIVNTHSIDITAKFAVTIKEKQGRLPMLYWLPKLHKQPYKLKFMYNYCFVQTANFLPKKKHSIRYYDTVYERDGINYFWSIKNSNDVLNKFKSKNFQAFKFSTYDFSTLYTTLSHHLIKDKLIDLMNRENTPYLACNEECAFFLLQMYTINTIYGRVKKSVMPLFIVWIIFLLDLVFRWELIVLLLFSIFGRVHRSLIVGFLLLQHFSCFVLSSPCRCCISVISWFFFVLSEM